MGSWRFPPVWKAGGPRGPVGSSPTSSAMCCNVEGLADRWRRHPARTRTSLMALEVRPLSLPLRSCAFWRGLVGALETIYGWRVERVANPSPCEGPSVRFAPSPPSAPVGQWTSRRFPKS